GPGRRSRVSQSARCASARRGTGRQAVTRGRAWEPVARREVARCDSSNSLRSAREESDRSCPVRPLGSGTRRSVAGRRIAGAARGLTGGSVHLGGYFAREGAFFARGVIGRHGKVVCARRQILHYVRRESGIGDLDGVRVALGRRAVVNLIPL